MDEKIAPNNPRSRLRWPLQPIPDTMSLNGDDTSFSTDSYEYKSNYTDESEELLGDLALASNWDAKTAAQWNTDDPRSSTAACIARYICSKDATGSTPGTATSRTPSLTAPANRLAHHLDSFALRPDEVVHRQRQIVNQTRAQLALCSALFAGLVEMTLGLDMRLKQNGETNSSAPVTNERNNRHLEIALKDSSSSCFILRLTLTSSPPRFLAR
ncbi:hypothetical protein BDV11DRAFT_174018 [Aspergillus similis]